MSFLDVITALGRQWLATVLGLMATAGLVWGVTTVEQPVYTARALVLLVPSEEAIGEGGNPFLALGGLDLPARVVVAYYESDVAKARFTSGSPDAEYVVAIEESTRGPVIAVDVTNATPQRTLGTLDRVTSSIPVELERLQAEVDAPEDAIVSTLVLAKDEQAKIDRSGTVRMVIAAAGAGLVATVVGAVAIDGLRRSRARGARAELLARLADDGSWMPVTGPPGLQPPDDMPPSIKLPADKAHPSWHNPAPDSRDRRRDDVPTAASTAETR